MREELNLRVAAARRRRRENLRAIAVANLELAQSGMCIDDKGVIHHRPAKKSEANEQRLAIERSKSDARDQRSPWWRRLVTKITGYDAY